MRSCTVAKTFNEIISSGKTPEIDEIVEVEKFNPYHDSKGRFSSSNGYASFTFRTKDPAKQHLADAATARERQKTTAAKPFVPAKTVQEATDYAKNTIGIANVEFGKLDISVCNDINEALTRYKNDFPDVVKDMDFVGSAQGRNRVIESKLKDYLTDKAKATFNKTTLPRATDDELQRYIDDSVSQSMKILKGSFAKKIPGDAYALSYPGNNGKIWNQCVGAPLKGIALNEKFFASGKAVKQGKASVEYSEKAKWHPEGTGTVKGIVDHEIGHQIDNFTKTSSDATTLKTMASAANSKGGMESAVSGYAKTNSAEFVAECWSEYTNNPNCRATAKSVGERMKTLYNQTAKGGKS